MSHLSTQKSFWLEIVPHCLANHLTDTKTTTYYPTYYVETRLWCGMITADETYLGWKMEDTECMKKGEVRGRQETGENGDEDGEAWAENEMGTSCKGQQTWLWTTEKEYEATVMACGRKREGEDISSCWATLCNYQKWTLLLLAAFIRLYSTTTQRNQLSLLSTTSDERWDRSYKMHVTAELFIMLFISLSYREAVSLKKHELRWLRYQVHQNDVPFAANMSPTCCELSKTRINSI